MVLTLTSGYANDGNVTTSFSKLSNSRERVRLLKDITDKKGTISVTETKALLNLGLSDKKPDVAAAAALQIGKLKYKEFEGHLIQTYTDASKRYKGHSERVRLVCIKSLGKLKGHRTASFLSRELAKDQGTVQGGFLLQAARELRDPLLIEDLEKYSLKMAEQIKKGQAENDDPMLYSLAKQHYEFAENTIQMLKELEGGNK
jgi:HEAT repeat protein